jgi:hypothetical protein
MKNFAKQFYLLVVATCMYAFVAQSQDKILLLKAGFD